MAPAFIRCWLAAQTESRFRQKSANEDDSLVILFERKKIGNRPGRGLLRGSSLANRIRHDSQPQTHRESPYEDLRPLRARCIVWIRHGCS